MKDHVEEELLQRYFDGELENEPAREIARHLETCAPCMGRHSALGRLQRALVLDAVVRARGIDSDALFARIEQGVRERPEPSAAERAEMRWEDTPQKKKPRPFLVPVAGALAAAAALSLFLRQAPPASEEPQPEAVGATTRLSGASSEVEQVDFGRKAGTVFDVMLGDDVSTPVIWLDDDDDDDEK